MLLKIIYNYIIGYVTVTIEGLFIERFINICISKKIFLWNSEREKNTILHTNISILDFRRIRKIAQKTKCRVHIKAKKGLPFIFKKYKKRKIFFASLLVIIIAIFVSSQFVWNIEVSGNEKISTEEVIADLEQAGLSTGMWKSNINLADVINEVRLKNSNVSWIGIELKGTNAVVEIAEALEKPELIDYDEICNIIANKDGIIRKINVQNGIPVAKVGDEVKQGDVLVTGKIEGKWTEPRYVHSMADIEAVVTYEKSKKMYFQQEKENKTGKVEKKYGIKFNNFEINLYKTLSKFEIYDTIDESKKIRIFPNFYLPIELIKLTNYEIIKQTEIYTKEELELQAKKELEEELKSEIQNPDNILNEKFNIKTVEQEYIEYVLIYEVTESLGVEGKMEEEQS